MNDLKFAFRQLLKYAGFTAVPVLTLAPVAHFRQCRRRRRGNHSIIFPFTHRNGQTMHLLQRTRSPGHALVTANKMAT